MAPIREYLCLECGHIMENLERVLEDRLSECNQCDSQKLEKLPSAHGGYSMASGPSSVRPKGAGSFKRSRK